MEPYELIFNNDTAQGIHSGGFSVNSIMLKKGISPLKTFNYIHQEGGDIGSGKVSDLFNGLVVPNWAYTSKEIIGGRKTKEETEDEDEDGADVIGDDLYESLLNLAKHPDTNTRPKKNNKTKRNVINATNATNVKKTGTKKHKQN